MELGKNRLPPQRVYASLISSLASVETFCKKNLDPTFKNNYPKHGRRQKQNKDGMEFPCHAGAKTHAKFI